MRILHLSDIHFGDEDPVAIAAVTRWTAEHQPDLIIASGDLSMDGLAAELEGCADWLASLGPPVVATPGNHDVPYYELWGRFWRPYRRYRRAARGRLLDAWRSPLLHVVTINTSRGWQLRLNWALGAISGAQVRAARRALRAAPPGALKIVVTHHPLIFPRGAPLEGATHGGVRAARKLAEAGADLLLCGHLHVSSEEHVTAEGPAVSVCTGTLSLRLRGRLPGFVTIDQDDSERLVIAQWDIENGTARQVSVRVLPRAVPTVRAAA